jgi:hypothetical protein
MSPADLPPHMNEAQPYSLARRPQRPHADLRPRLRGPDDLVHLIEPYLADEEAVFGVYMTLKQHVLGVECLHRGPLTDAALSPTVVYRPAVRHGAAAYALLCSRPDGDPEPSDLELRLMRRLAFYAGELGIPILDYVSLTPHGYVSQRHRELLDSPITNFGHTPTYDTHAARITLGQPHSDTLLGWYTGDTHQATTAAHALAILPQPLKP